jgi:hypothetical protein
MALQLLGAQKAGFREVWVFSRFPEATFDLMKDGLRREDLYAACAPYTSFLFLVSFCRG